MKMSEMQTMWEAFLKDEREAESDSAELHFWELAYLAALLSGGGVASITANTAVSNRRTFIGRPNPKSDI